MAGKAEEDVVVITCELTGGIHGKEANPRLPEQPDEIVEQGIAVWKAGAAVLHVHARKPDGSSTMDAAIFGELHERLCAETDAVVQLTTGGSPRLPVAERVRTVHLAPEMASLNMGLLNFFIRGEQVFFSNHRSDIEAFARTMVERLRDLPVPAADLRVTVTSMGLNARVGLEDNVYFRRGELAHSNVQLVERAVRIARELERRPATPAEARAILGLRGRAAGRLPADPTARG